MGKMVLLDLGNRLLRLAAPFRAPGKGMGAVCALNYYQRRLLLHREPTPLTFQPQDGNARRLSNPMAPGVLFFHVLHVRTVLWLRNSSVKGQSFLAASGRGDSHS